MCSFYSLYLLLFVTLKLLLIVCDTVDSLFVFFGLLISFPFGVHTSDKDVWKCSTWIDKVQLIGGGWKQEKKMMLSVIFGGKYCNSLGNCILCSALFLRFFLSLSHSIFLPLFFLHSHSRFSSLVYLLYCAINMASNALTSAFITLTYTQHTSCLFFILNERKKKHTQYSK